MRNSQDIPQVPCLASSATGDGGEWLNRVHFGDCLETLRRMPDGIVNTCVTSPPYFGLRDYGHAGQIGLEETPEAFIAKLVEVFREVRRVLRPHGTLWVNMGDSYADMNRNAEKRAKDASGVVRPSATKSCELCGKGFWGGRGRRFCSASCGGSDNSKRAYRPGGIKAKDLIGIPWMLAFALRADGWYLRQDIVWAKPNPMPESVTDRCTKAHEYIFLLSKSPRYYCDMTAIQEPETMKPQQRLTSLKDNPENKVHSRPVYRQAEGSTGGGMRNKRSVWTVATKPYAGAHFATYPEELIEPCILAGAPAGGVVLDPFFGSGTTGQVAQNLGRQWIGCELNPAYKPLQDERLRQPGLILEAA